MQVKPTLEHGYCILPTFFPHLRVLTFALDTKILDTRYLSDAANTLRIKAEGNSHVSLQRIKRLTSYFLTIFDVYSSWVHIVTLASTSINKLTEHFFPTRSLAEPLTDKVNCGNMISPAASPSITLQTSVNSIYCHLRFATRPSLVYRSPAPYLFIKMVQT